MGKYTSTANKSSKDIRQKSLTNNFQPIILNVAGIDIGAKEIFVAAPNHAGEMYVRSFGTTTPQLHEIAKWLKDLKVSSAAMEATGVYWIPLFEILEDAGLTPLLVDAKSVKNVPGRKTDVLDCQWIQKLYSCGF